MTYRRKIKQVRGWQFNVGAVVPDWFVAEDAAVQIRVYDSESDTHYAALGSWVIRLPDGSFETRTNEEFEEEFEPDEEKNWR